MNSKGTLLEDEEDSTLVSSYQMKFQESILVDCCNPSFEKSMSVSEVLFHSQKSIHEQNLRNFNRGIASSDNIGGR